MLSYRKNLGGVFGVAVTVVLTQGDYSVSVRVAVGDSIWITIQEIGKIRVVVSVARTYTASQCR